MGPPCALLEATTADGEYGEKNRRRPLGAANDGDRAAERVGNKVSPLLNFLFDDIRLGRHETARPVEVEQKTLLAMAYLRLLDALRRTRRYLPHEQTDNGAYD